MRCASALLFLACAGLPCLAATGLSCESTPAVEAAGRNLNRELEGATFEQSIILRQQAYEEMRQLDPQDYRPAYRYMRTVRYDTPEKWDAFRDGLVSEARSHPQDSYKLVVAAMSLSGKDTPQAMRFLEQSIASNPDYAPAYSELSGYYAGSGKYIDKAKAATYLQKFYQLCPVSRDSSAMYALKKSESSELKAEVPRICASGFLLRKIQMCCALIRMFGRSSFPICPLRNILKKGSASRPISAACRNCRFSPRQSG